jgi:hypothetical protein
MSEARIKSQDYVETWDGGFVRTDAKGRKVYVIRRMINGKNYKVTLFARPWSSSCGLWLTYRTTSWRAFRTSSRST